MNRTEKLEAKFEQRGILRTLHSMATASPVRSM
jgi:hypothetical protein